MSYALIAGGSKGIGFAIAEALAIRGYDLILIARHMDALLEAKNKLEQAYGIHVDILSKDLSMKNTAIEIADWCIEHDKQINILCNVAGLGGADDYLQLPLEKLRYMVNLNTLSDVTLTFTMLPILERNTPSYILNVASMAGFAPIPEKNLYAATKASVLFFSYALRYQLAEKDISVSCLCPGPVFTKPEIKKVTEEKLGWFGLQMAVPPKKVGEIAVRNMLKGKMIIVPGAIAKVMSVVLRALPRRFAAYIYSKF